MIDFSGALSGIVREGNSVRGNFRPGPDFAGFGGHFPGNPTLPGVCIPMAARIMLEQAFSTRYALRSAGKVKFFRPVKPGETLEYRMEFDGTNAAVAVFLGGERVSVMKLVLRGRKSDPS